MQTTTISQSAQETAEKNAAKMTAQGYTMEAGTAPNIFWVQKPNSEVEYFVNPAKGLCNCPFAAEHGTCKHAVWVAENLRADAEAEAREYAEADRYAKF